MSVLIMKNRARKPIARGDITGTGVCYYKVGGIEGSPPVYSFLVGDINVHLSKGTMVQLLTDLEIYNKLSDDWPG